MAIIPQQTLEQIAAANDIVEVIGSYLPLRRAGGAYKAICPFHQEKSPSFTVNPQRQIFKCFGCGAGGGVFKFVELYEHVSFPDAVKKLADRAGIRIIEEQVSEEDDRKFRMRKRLLALHGEAAEWFHRNLLKTEAAQAARAYLKGRGLSADVAKSWKIGYAPDSWDALGNWAQRKGYTVPELIQSGLVKQSESDGQPSTGTSRFYDRFRNRIMFPICNDIGEVIAFSGRVLDPAAKEAKYVNSPETILFTKGNVLFGLHKSKRPLIEKGVAIVCEGQLDLITAFEAGVQNVIAPQGTAFTDKQARLLKRHVEEVILCFDSDNAGQKAAERSLAHLLAVNLSVRVAEMPPGHDPDSLIRQQGAEAFAERMRLARDFFDFQIDRQANTPEFATPRGKMLFARKMAELAGVVSDPVMREAVINNVTARIGISPNEFRAMLARTPHKDQNTSVAGNDNEAQIEVLELTKAMSLLCLLGLRHAETRQWLQGHIDRAFLANEPGADLLIKILGTDLRPDNVSSINAFLASLDTSEEPVASSLLLEKIPDHPGPVAADCLRDLERRDIKRRQETLAARMRQPGLPMEQIIKLQKEILDLQKHFTDIARPLSSSREA